MKVAICTREYPPEVYGGAGVHVEYLARALREHVDVEVHAFGEPRPDPLVVATYQPWQSLGALTLPGAAGKAGGEGAAYMAALRTFSVDLAMAAGVAGADVVHTHTWYANLAGFLAAKTHGIPHVMTSHSLEPLRPWKREQLGGGYELSLWAERTAIEAADAVIAVSAGMRDDILRSYPAVDPARVHVIHNGVDVAEYRRDESVDGLEQLGIDVTLPTVVYLGRITRQKGLPHLLDAASHLPDGTQLVLCAGSPDTPEIGEEVAACVDALRASGDLRVVWIRDMLPREMAVRVLSHATVFVCPSIYEPFGLVNVEAMACGVPVVASAVGGIPEIVVNGSTGYLVPFEPGSDPFGSPADPARFARDLAERIGALLADPTGARRMGVAARARVEAEFSWSSIARATVELYRSLAR